MEVQNIKEVQNLTIESEVRSYSRYFYDTFNSADGSIVNGESGKSYIDFLSGCGGLNYGHNDRDIQASIIEYLKSQGIVMSMDMSTKTKEEFLSSFQQIILKPRSLDYKVQFTGPTGANAVEAAIKLARKVTGRTNVIAFTNAFHGCTLGALSLTGNSHHRQSSTSLLNQVTRHPYDGYLDPSIDTAEYLEKLIEDRSSGIDLPAAIIVECIQGEGGLNVASKEWLIKLRKIATENEIILIVDDIQAGCGRRGTFFSFEEQGFIPDIIVLAKSLSGYGLPLSLVLFKPELDLWEPGEHNGTFRGNNLGFVSATATLKKHWTTNYLTLEVKRKEKIFKSYLKELEIKYGFEIKGCGLIIGIDTKLSEYSKTIRDVCFQNGLIIETCGPEDTVIKFLPALTIPDKLLNEGLKILSESIKIVMDLYSKKISV